MCLFYCHFIFCFGDLLFSFHVLPTVCAFHLTGAVTSLNCFRTLVGNTVAEACLWFLLSCKVNGVL